MDTVNDSTASTIRRQLIDNILGAASLSAPVVAIFQTYRVLDLDDLPPTFLLTSAGLLSLPVIYYFRSKISYSAKLVVILLITTLGLAFTLRNQGLIGQAPLILVVFSLLVINLYGSRYFSILIAIVLFSLALAATGHLQDWYPPVPNLSNPVVLTSRIITTTLLISIFLVSHRTLMQSLIELSEKLQASNKELSDKNQALTEAAQQIENLENLMSVCAWCKKVEDSPGSGQWISMHQYLERKSDVSMSHGLCKDCYAEQLKNIE